MLKEDDPDLVFFRSKNTTLKNLIKVEEKMCKTSIPEAP
jgi:hypothetical protein